MISAVMFPGSAGGKKMALLNSCFPLSHSSTLKMETVCSTETPLNFCRITRSYISEESALRMTKLYLNLFHFSF
jgi:hypothetical protein